MRNKDIHFARHGTTVSGLIFISAIISCTSVRTRRRRGVANRNGVANSNRFAAAALAA